MKTESQGKAVVEKLAEGGFLVMTPDGEVQFRARKQAAEKLVLEWFQANVDPECVGVGIIEWRGYSRQCPSAPKKAKVERFGEWGREMFKTPEAASARVLELGPLYYWTPARHCGACDAVVFEVLRKEPTR